MGVRQRPDATLLCGNLQEMTRERAVPATTWRVASRACDTTFTPMKAFAVPLALVASLALSPSGGAVEAALPDALRRCATIPVEAERLACFDRLASSVAVPSEGGTVTLGRWQVTASAGSSGPVIVADQRPLEPWGEESIILEISCRDDRVSLSVGRDSPVMAAASVFATVRVNDRLAPSDIWQGSRDLQQAIYPGDVRDFLSRLPATGTLAIRLEGSRRWRFEGTYQLEGIAEIRRRILAACSR